MTPNEDRNLLCSRESRDPPPPVTLREDTPGSHCRLLVLPQVHRNAYSHEGVGAPHCAFGEGGLEGPERVPMTAQDAGGGSRALAVTGDPDSPAAVWHWDGVVSFGG